MPHSRSLPSGSGFRSAARGRSLRLLKPVRLRAAARHGRDQRLLETLRLHEALRLFQAVFGVSFQTSSASRLPWAPVPDFAAPGSPSPIGAVPAGGFTFGCLLRGELPSGFLPAGFSCALSGFSLGRASPRRASYAAGNGLPPGCVVTARTRLLARRELFFAFGEAFWRQRGRPRRAGGLRRNDAGALEFAGTRRRRHRGLALVGGLELLGFTLAVRTWLT